MAQSAQDEDPLDGKLIREVEFNSTATDVFGFYRSRCHLFKDIMHQKINNVELVRGDWDKVGSERLWTLADGCGTWKDIVEAIDSERKSITWALIDGDVPRRRYSSLKVEHQFSHQCNRPMATAILTYRKNNISVMVPTDYMDFILEMLAAAANA